MKKLAGDGFMELLPMAPMNWEWVAPHLSRRISGISELRAKDLAARNGGGASEMIAARHAELPPYR